MSVQTDLYGLIDQSGLVSAYRKYSLWNAEVVQPDWRVLLVRNVQGYTSDKFSRRHGFSIFGISAINDQNIEGIRTDMEALVTYLLQNHQFNCIIGVEVVGDTSGVFQMEDGRLYFKFDVTVTSVINS
jgi:hypothetical protein